MSVVSERPRRGLWRTEIVRAVLSGHSILGISFAAVIYIVCLTGTLCVFMRDFQRWEQPEMPVVRSMSDAATARAIEAMGTRAGPDKPFYVSLPSVDLPRLVLSTGNDPDDETWIAHANGRLAVKQRSVWIDFVVELHTRLQLPETWGRFIVGLAGVALFSSLISGVLAHPRIFRDAFFWRRGGSRRLEQADLHNRLGVWPLPFHIIVTLTGALLGLSTVIVGVLALLLFRGDATQVYALLGPPPPAVDARPAPVPDIAGMLAVARARAPGAELQQINVSHWGRRDMRVELTASRPQLLAQQDNYSFDTSGRLVSEQHPSGQNVGQQILGSLGPLHFGWFGGLAVRIVYGLLGIALCVVTSSGINVWLARRRDKGRPAPTWERVWATVSWGQPAALAVTALTACIWPNITEETLALLWLLSTVALVAGAAASNPLDAPKLSISLRAMTSMALVGTALSSFAVHGIAGNEPILDLVILTSALLIVRPLRPVRFLSRRLIA